ncbi:sulfoquinovose isomerase [Peribacillus muralis]|uniref:sulfoquinovose isomerase n=1 Tax=Peribacillus muralis TaxID=264697 RepID=UPI003D026952
MLNTVVLYVPIGRKTFDIEAAETYRKQSMKWLEESCSHLVAPDQTVTSVEELQDFLDSINDVKIDTILYQSVTFADGEFMVKILEYFKQPVIVWSVREPSVGGRLRLNSLTGGNSTSNVLRNHKHPFAFAFGNPDEEALRKRLLRQFNVMRVYKALSELKIGVVGDYPPGFFFSQANEGELQTALGVSLHKIDLQEAFAQCVKLPEQEWIGEVDRAERQVIGLNRNDETVTKFAQFSTYIKKHIQQQELDALAMRCWPDFFNELGAAPCSTLSQFTEDGMVTSCESDIHGAVSMFILRELAGGNAPYLGDLVHVDEVKNSVVFWHCGAGAYSLANPATGATVGVHPNRKIGFAMDFGLKAGVVTVFRVSHTPEGYRLLVMKGNALDVEQPFSGTSVEVELKTDVTDTLYKLMHAGYEPHFALVYGDVTEHLIELGRMLQLPTEVYV